LKPAINVLQSSPKLGTSIYLRCKKKRKVYAMKKKECFRLHFESLSHSCEKQYLCKRKTVERIEPIVNEESHSAMEKALGRGRMHRNNLGGQQPALSSRYNWIFNGFALSLSSLDRKPWNTKPTTCA
jgi:hypothetical protein